MGGWVGVGGGVVIYIRVWCGGTGGGYHLIVFVIFSCALVFCCLRFSVPLFRTLEYDGCCSCFFALFFFVFF